MRTRRRRAQVRADESEERALDDARPRARVRAVVGAVGALVLAVEVGLWLEAARLFDRRVQPRYAQSWIEPGREWTGVMPCGPHGGLVQVHVDAGESPSVEVTPLEAGALDRSKSLKIPLAPRARPWLVEETSDFAGLGPVVRVRSENGLRGDLGLRRDGHPAVVWVSEADPGAWLRRERFTFKRVFALAETPTRPALAARRPSDRPEAQLLADVASGDPVARLAALLDLEALGRRGALLRADEVRRAATAIADGVEDGPTAYARERLLQRLSGADPDAPSGPSEPEPEEVRLAMPRWDQTLTSADSPRWPGLPSAPVWPFRLRPDAAGR